MANAIKYCRERPHLHITATRTGNEVLFSFRDNGIGIAPEHAEDIFFMLKRLHGRAEFSGSGVGLAVCKRIVERHGGRIWVDCAHDKGSEFLFTLPASKTDFEPSP